LSRKRRIRTEAYAAFPRRTARVPPGGCPSSSSACSARPRSPTASSAGVTTSCPTSRGSRSRRSTRARRELASSSPPTKGPYGPSSRRARQSSARSRAQLIPGRRRLPAARRARRALHLRFEEVASGAGFHGLATALRRQRSRRVRNRLRLAVFHDYVIDARTSAVRARCLCGRALRPRRSARCYRADEDRLPRPAEHPPEEQHAGRADDLFDGCGHVVTVLDQATTEYIDDPTTVASRGPPQAGQLRRRPAPFSKIYGMPGCSSATASRRPRS